MRARVYVRALERARALAWRAVPARGLLHAPTLTSHPPHSALVILTDADARISVVSPLSEGVSSAGEDELEDVLSDVEEAPKSKKKKKAKKSSRDSKSSKRQRPVREVCICASSRFILKCDYVDIVLETHPRGRELPGRK